MILGIDVGSIYTKGILFDGEIKNKIVVKTSFKPKQAIEEVKKILNSFDKIAATGYGRELVTDADLVITEVSAFARGASFIHPSARTIIDIGGQDSKIIKLRNGKLNRFVMNDRCAAGTGNFIEKIAQSLDLTLEEFGNLALKSENPESIDSLCVVMAESEILSLVSEGKRVEDIVLGVCDALIRRIISIGSQVEIEAPIIFCGGGALNLGLVKAMNRIPEKIIIPTNPQFIGALGAALTIS